MHIHDADFPPEVAGALGTLKIGLHPPVISHGTIKKMRPVGPQQVFADQAKMSRRLFRRNHIVDDGMNHRQQTVGQTGRTIPWMK